MITSNNYCKISGGGGNSLSKNMHYVHVVVNFLLLHKGLGALCAWEAACLLLFVFTSFYSNFIQIFKCTGFQRGKSDETRFLRNANCA